MTVRYYPKFDESLQRNPVRQCAICLDYATNDPQELIEHTVVCAKHAAMQYSCKLTPKLFEQILYDNEYSDIVRSEDYVCTHDKTNGEYIIYERECGCSDCVLPMYRVMLEKELNWNKYYPLCQKCYNKYIMSYYESDHSSNIRAFCSTDSGKSFTHIILERRSGNRTGTNELCPGKTVLWERSY